MKTRFAPSPTGPIHIGNARTALFNYLLARQRGGQFILRIEDTNTDLSSEEHIDALYRDLRALGLDWDLPLSTKNGTTQQDRTGPYRQSQRGAIYAEHYARLQHADRAYPCFCTEQTLRLLRKRQLAAGEPPRYNGVCRHLSPAEVAARQADGLSAVLRLHIKEEGTVVFDDLVRGPQVFQTQHLGDFIIRRSDGSPSFMFANAVDDALMGVDCVLRGEDHLTNTPRQLLVLRALDLPEPQYAHIALITGSDGAPLSKRNGSRALADLLAEGYLPRALVNYLARLGCSYANDALCSLRELSAGFAPPQLARAAARFDLHQLAHWQRLALMAMQAEQLCTWMGESVLAKVPRDARAAFARIITPNILLPAEAVPWAECLYGDGQPKMDSETKELCHLAHTLYAAEDSWSKTTQLLAQRSGKRGARLFKPLRQALTGRQDGPALDDLVALLGKERVLQRLRDPKD